ncbi:hypothetical protein H6F95_31865 [Cyanobacteria bacterium FACHB-471]|nr:hypothetical protein [Cyanobacteria bacterium FACHB-471]
MANEENLKHFARADETVEPLASKATQVRLPISVSKAVEELGKQKTAWLRRVISEAAQREGLL